MPELGQLREVTVLIDPDQRSPTYMLDVPTLKDLLKLEPNCAADLIVILRGRPGQELRGWLEAAPEARVSIDPDNPPDWLH
jgi:hypothetical protein